MVTDPCLLTKMSNNDSRESYDIIGRAKAAQKIINTVLHIIARGDSKFIETRHLSCLLVVVEFLQIFLLVTEPSLGWRVDQEAWYGISCMLQGRCRLVMI